MGGSADRRWPALDVRPVPEWLEVALVDYRLVAIDEQRGDAWRLFFEDASARDRARSGLQARFPHVEVEPVDVADEDWARRSQAGLRAVRVGGVVVAPPWDIPPDSGDTRLLTIVIEPSTGFGTGHHATTRLCLAALQRIDLANQSLIDVGTGSGVLAIGARLLGAAPVVGIDDDADAVLAARQNVLLNGSPEVELVVADIRSVDRAPASVVTANLTGSLLEQIAARLRSLVASGGRLIVSGFTADEEQRVRAALAATDVSHRGREDDWICLTLQLPR